MNLVGETLWGVLLGIVYFRWLRAKSGTDIYGLRFPLVSALVFFLMFAAFNSLTTEPQPTVRALFFAAGYLSSLKILTGLFPRKSKEIGGKDNLDAGKP